MIPYVECDGPDCEERVMFTAAASDYRPVGWIRVERYQYRWEVCSRDCLISAVAMRTVVY